MGTALALLSILLGILLALEMMNMIITLILSALNDPPPPPNQPVKRPGPVMVRFRQSYKPIPVRALHLLRAG